jgi:hypothetical protein
VDPSKSKGRIPLPGAVMCTFQEAEYGKKYAFGIKPADSNRTYVLVAESEHARLEVRKLKRALSTREAPLT